MFLQQPRVGSDSRPAYPQQLDWTVGGLPRRTSGRIATTGSSLPDFLGLVLMLALALPAIVLPAGCASPGSDGPSTSAASTSTAPATQPQRPESRVADSGTVAGASEQSAGETGGHTITSSRARYMITFTPRPHEIPLNELFTLQVDVVDAALGRPVDEGVQLSVDAAMPTHRHGMNTRPEVERTGAGSFVVSGMLFHMPGEWELYFDLTRNGVTERALETVVLD